MGLALILIGLLLLLLTSWQVVGIVLLVVGIILVFVPGTYGYDTWRGRRGPP
jgi:membrane protein implicated in regulation of membrane protease activity